MLAGPVGHFNFTVDNWGATYSNTGIGVSATASATANAKGSNTNLLNGIAEDGYFLQIGFAGGDTSATSKRYLSDIKIDPAAGVGNAGASWTNLIDNLAANNANFGVGYGQWYGFPIFIPKGTAIGCALQSATASATLRHMIRVFGKPSRPEAIGVGQKVQTLGATTATTVGTTVTPGTNAKGSYSATLGTLNRPSWWFQCGVLSNDTTMLANSYLFDVAVGDATNKYLAVRDMPYNVHTTAEQASKGAWGTFPPEYDGPSGSNVYVRGSGAGAPDSAMSALVYAVQ